MILDARVCPICASNRNSQCFSNIMAALDGLDMSYHIASCLECGFVFANRLPQLAVYTSYYRSLSKYDVVSVSSESSETDQLRSEAIVDLLRLHFGSDARIVDLGCGSGMLLAALHVAGWVSLAGLDPAPAAAEQAKRRYGLNCVRCGTLEQAPKLLDLSSFDLVCLTGVLEHLPRLREDLQALASSVGPHTRFLVEVPALERCSRKQFEPYGEFSLEHIQFFSAASLKRLFESVGYSAMSLAFVDLPEGDFDSILGLFSLQPSSGSRIPTVQVKASLDQYLTDYITRSEEMIQSAIMRIKDCHAGELIIYGAGSHTARLLPLLLAAGEDRLVGLIDSNPNLHGKYLGPCRIEGSAELSRYPEATIIVSSFRSQKEIVASLRGKFPNPLILLY